MAPSPSYVLRGTSPRLAEARWVRCLSGPRPRRDRAGAADVSYGGPVTVAPMIGVEVLSEHFGETGALDQITLSVGQAGWLRCSDRTERGKPR